MSLSVSAVVLSYNRRDALERTLDHLAHLPVDEVVVVDNGSTDGTAERLAERGGAERVLAAGANLGIAGRNRGAELAHGDLLLMLDDDCHPVPGAIEALRGAFEAVPRLGALGGLVRDVDDAGRVLLTHEVGTFDWFLRGGRSGPAPAEGFPTFFFPEGASMLRRAAFEEVGGFYEPFFHHSEGVELATRMTGAGWEVRYLPAAAFDHHKEQSGRSVVGDPKGRGLRLRVRNQLWYFWLRFPAGVAARRVPAYLAFDLVQCAYLGVLRAAWLGGIADAWSDRERIRGDRSPLARDAVRRAELNRGRMHVRLLAHMLRRGLMRAAASARPR